nr:uncharacterized protein LOC110584100 [Neomonachus schauinslandi]
MSLPSPAAAGGGNYVEGGAFVRERRGEPGAGPCGSAINVGRGREEQGRDVGGGAGPRPGRGRRGAGPGRGAYGGRKRRPQTFRSAPRSLPRAGRLAARVGWRLPGVRGIRPLLPYFRGAVSGSSRPSRIVGEWRIRNRPRRVHFASAFPVVASRVSEQLCENSCGCSLELNTRYQPGTSVPLRLLSTSWVCWSPMEAALFSCSCTWLLTMGRRGVWRHLPPSRAADATSEVACSSEAAAAGDPQLQVVCPLALELRWLPLLDLAPRNLQSEMSLMGQMGSQLREEKSSPPCLLSVGLCRDRAQPRASQRSHSQEGTLMGTSPRLQSTRWVL